MVDRYTKALHFVLDVEGGTSNDPDDPGGLTSRGITKATAERAYQKGIAGTADPRRLDQAEIANIYKQFYWYAVSAPSIPEPVDLILFDCAVNCGVNTSIELLQEALHELDYSLTIDGLMGPETKQTTYKATSKNENKRILANEFLLQRIWYYNDLNNKKFIRGWINRMYDLKQEINKELN